MNFKSKPDSLDDRLSDIDADFSEDVDDAREIYGGVVGSVAPPPTTPNAPERPAVKPPEAPTNTNWSTSVNTLLDQPPSSLPVRVLLGGMAFTLAFGTWAWVGKIEQVGHAQGRLVPKGQVYKIDPQDPGKIARVAIKEGDDVKAGQVIAEMDTNLAANEVERLKQSLAADQIQLSQTSAMIERTRAEAQSRAAISDADIKAQQTAIAQAKANAATSGELIAQLQADAAALQGRQQRLKPFVEEGALSKDFLFNAEESLRDRQRTILQSQGELKQAQAEAARLQAGLVQKQAEKRTAQLEAQQRIQQMEVELTQLKAKIADTKNLLNNANNQLAQRFLRAPVNGYVTALNIQNTGQVVQPGQTIAELAPHSAPLILLANLPTHEAGFVKVGLPVQVKMDAYPYQDYGIVPGKIIAISPDIKVDERLGNFYQVQVGLARNYVNTNQQTIKFKAGQTAAADIIIRRRRVAEVLLDPIRQLQKGGINL